MKIQVRITVGNEGDRISALIDMGAVYTPKTKSYLREVEIPNIPKGRAIRSILCEEQDN